MTDLLTAYGCQWHTIGLRDGEKLHEKMDPEHSSETPDEWVGVEELKEAICFS
jgi:FlaA1/EpsC-like NDP-sugar epimerase